MPTRAEILDILAASQTQVMAFFQGLSPQDMERPAMVSDVPGAAPWSAKDHLAHLVYNERNIQHLLRHALEGSPRDVFLLAVLTRKLTSAIPMMYQSCIWLSACYRHAESQVHQHRIFRCRHRPPDD